MRPERDTPLVSTDSDRPDMSYGNDYERDSGIRPVRSNPAGFPKVQGACPACGARSLFLAADGYVTCALLSCCDPCSASVALGVAFPAKAKEA